MSDLRLVKCHEMLCSLRLALVALMNFIYSDLVKDLQSSLDRVMEEESRTGEKRAA